MQGTWTNISSSEQMRTIVVGFSDFILMWHHPDQNAWQPALGAVIVSFDPGGEAGDVEDMATGQAANLTIFI